MATLQQHINDYINYLTVEAGRSPKTAMSYQHYLQRFAEFVGQNMPIAKLNKADITKYRQYLNSTGIAKNTQNYHVIAIRSFLKYLAAQDVKAIPYHTLEVAKSVRTDVDVLSTSEVKRLLQAPRCSSMIGLRDRAILELLFSSGLRVAELVSLDTKTIVNNSGEFVIRGKGSKDRLVFISERANKSLTQYINSREDDNPALFVELATRQSLRLSVRSIQRLVSHYAELAGIDKHVTPHTLRHSFATNLLSNGADIRYIQELLGHSSIATTQFYTHLSSPSLKKAHSQYHNLEQE